MLKTCADNQTLMFDETKSKSIAIQSANECLSSRSAEERIAWSLDHLPEEFVVTSSFGAQAAVTLALLTDQHPDIPVILVDTGYLFPETYQFIDNLANRLKLNLKVYGPGLSSAWQEARFGKRWEQGLKGIDSYNRENKVEPLERALKELKAKTWFAGLRRQQADSRKNLEILQGFGERWKVHPILDWSDRDIYDFLKKNHLPYHPLWDKGYVSIGDVHTTKSLNEVDNIADTRFFGLKRECGIHEINFGEIEAA